jgi:hypothetical protein
MGLALPRSFALPNLLSLPNYPAKARHCISIAPIFILGIPSIKLFVLWVIDPPLTRLNHVLGEKVSIGVADTFLRLGTRHECAQPK